MPENDKPIDPDELAKLVHAALRPEPPSLTPSYGVHWPTPLETFIERYVIGCAYSGKNDSEPSVLVHAAKQAFKAIYPDYKGPV